MTRFDNDAASDAEMFARLAAADRPSPGGSASAPGRGALEAGLLDIAYATLDSPIGPLLVAATIEGVVRVAFEREGHDAVLTALAAAISPRILRATQVTDPVVRELEEYFAGRRRRFDVAVDLRLVGGFRRTVLAHLPAIAYGATATYARARRGVRQPGGGPRRGERLLAQPRAARRALPPCRPQRRHDRQLPRWHRGEGDPAGAGVSGVTIDRVRAERPEPGRSPI